MRSILSDEQEWALAWAMVMSNEGRQYTDHPDDQGGPTKFGVSLAQWRKQRLIVADLDGDGDVDADDIKALTEGIAAEWFKANYWDRFNLHDLLDSLIAAMVFDAIVNLGPRSGVRCAQRALRAVHQTHPTVRMETNRYRKRIMKIDGIWGPVTEAAMNSMRDKTGGAWGAAFSAEVAGYYRMIVQRDPSQKVFLTGWLNRAYGDELNLE